MPSIPGYSREISVRIKSPRAAEQHWRDEGWMIVKHLSSHIAILHGSPDGHLPRLLFVQAVAVERKIRIKAYVCCYPLAARKRYPELNILGGWDAESGLDFEPWGIRIYIA